MLQSTLDELNKVNKSFSLFIKDNVLFLKSNIHNEWLPFSINFSNNELIRRIHQKNQEIIKAVGIKNGYRPKILDTTAGLGRDSFILASLGCKVTMLERNPTIYLLLNNALENAKSNQSTKEIAKNLSLENIDSIEYLKNPKNTFDIIYIDPMFPKTNKSRLVKKDMQIFREIVGDDIDSGNLFNTALKQNAKRIIVKRMRKSEYLLGKKPSFEIIGNITRFDIYLWDSAFAGE
jgi:16S rRNA (guanine1516-N2)-methyltransferase